MRTLVRSPPSRFERRRSKVLLGPLTLTGSVGVYASIPRGGVRVKRQHEAMKRDTTRWKEEVGIKGIARCENRYRDELLAWRNMPAGFRTSDAGPHDVLLASVKERSKKGVFSEVAGKGNRRKQKIKSHPEHRLPCIS